MLGAGEDGGGHPLGLGGGEDEEDVGRGLLQGLEEGVEGAFGEHVGLVQDEDLPGGREGGEVDPFPQLPHVLHGVVAGGVNLHHVRVGAPLHRLAVGADPARGSSPWHPTAMARSLAVVVLPTPLGPEKR